MKNSNLENGREKKSYTPILILCPVPRRDRIRFEVGRRHGVLGLIMWIKKLFQE